MWRVLATPSTIFVYLEPLRHLALVFCRVVIPTLTLVARKNDDVTHCHFLKLLGLTQRSR